MIRFIHTADWQIGKPFAAMPDVAAQLRAARLDAIDVIAAHARSLGIGHVLVAGDVYDGQNLARPSMLGPLERMRQASGLRWWLLPGNHDFHAAGGIWERVLAHGLPDNVTFCGTPEPVEMAPGTFILPAPLMSRHTEADTTAWMDGAATPEGCIRIGLAHGSIKDFGQKQESPNVIDPARASRAGLDFLALGDWHGLKQVSPRTWYPGTPEPDAFREAQSGTALDVTVHGSGLAPVVTEIATGTFHWIRLERHLSDGPSVADLATQIARDTSKASLVRLTLTGGLAPADWAPLDRALDLIRARVTHLDVRRDGLGLAIDQEALASLRLDGLLGQVAEGLARDAGGDGAEAVIARDALVELCRRTGAL